MLKHFSKLTVRNQLLSLLGIMGLVMIVFSGIVLFERGNSYLENRTLEEIVTFSVEASAFVHESQKERGMTAAFTKSGGKKFAAELPVQRKVTNEKKESFLAYTEASNIRQISDGLTRSVDSALSAVGKMDSTRSRIDSHSIAPKDAIGFYTNLNADLLSAIASALNESKDSEILIQLFSYVNFLQGKERAGIERAVATAAFSNQFSVAIIQKLNILIAEQKTYLDVFQGLALPEQIEFFKSALNDNAVKEVDRMREVARASVATGDFGGVTAGYWFKNITQKINILKSIEDKLSENLLVSVRHAKSAAFSSLLILGGITAFSLLVVVLLARNFSTGLNACFSALKASLRRGAVGDFKSRIIHIKSEGEMREVQELANTLMDQADVFVREAASSMEAVSKEQYYRKILVKGFAGSYLVSANSMNGATSTAEVKASELQGLMKELEDTVKSVVNDTSTIAGNMKEASATMLSSSTNSVTKSDEVEAQQR